MQTKNEQRDQVIKDYSRRIYGFAYGKLKHTVDAEDLASDILLNLCKKSWETLEIDHMDAYIYRICQYTWSKYLRRHKKKWLELENSGLDALACDQDMSHDLIQDEVYQDLRQEVMLLSATKRKVLIGYYYDQKDSKTLGRDLGISPSTVRWHLLQGKKELKMRMETERKSLHRPVQMWLGYYGYCENDTYKLLMQDPLLQNVAYICQEAPLSVEDISRQLGVAAYYFEHKLEQMVDLAYMIQKKGRYQTNFFIQDAKYYDQRFRFLRDHIGPLSDQVYKGLEEKLQAIRALDFHGAHLDQEELIWHLLPNMVSVMDGYVEGVLWPCLDLNSNAPMRADGTEHWLCGGLIDPEGLELLREKEADFYDYCLYSGGSGDRKQQISGLVSHQVDSNLLGQRPSLTEEDMHLILHLLDRGSVTEDSYQQERLGGLIEKGIIDPQTHLLKIPYLTRDQKKNLDGLMIDICQGLEGLISTYEAYGKSMAKVLPGHLSGEEKDHYKREFAPTYALMYDFLSKGRLRSISPDNQARFGRLIWQG